MKPIVLIATAEGSLKITAEEIQKMVEEAYQAGYADGRTSVPQPITVPSYPLTYPTWLQSPIVTCTTETTTIHSRTEAESDKEADECNTD